MSVAELPDTKSVRMNAPVPTDFRQSLISPYLFTTSGGTMLAKSLKSVLASRNVSADVLTRTVQSSGAVIDNEGSLTSLGYCLENQDRGLVQYMLSVKTASSAVNSRPFTRRLYSLLG